MPIYEYQCDNCGVFEVSQRITEDSLKKCPTCKAKVKRLISNTSFMLKGSGWYATDYGHSKTNPTSSNESNSSTGSNGKSSESKSSESKSGDSKSSESSSSSTSSEKSSSSSDKAASST
jgi:putative FmdB family regulatory protein